MDSFKLEILVPSGKILSDAVQAVTMQTEIGQVGILPQHASYTTTLGTGILEYSSADGRTRNSLVVSGGIAQFSDNTLRILADSVDQKEKIKKNEYDKERQSLEAALTSMDSSSPEWALNKTKLERIEAIDMLLSHGDKASLN